MSTHDKWGQSLTKYVSLASHTRGECVVHKIKGAPIVTAILFLCLQLLSPHMSITNSGI